MNREKETGKWLAIVDKYFNATATAEEEHSLAAFLTTEASCTPEFDEIKAVMGYIAVARNSQKKIKRIKSLASSLKWTTAAAAITIAAAIGFSDTGTDKEEENILAQTTESSHDVYVAYIDGKRYTDEETVLRQMHETMAMIGNTTRGNAVEEQLTAMFDTANN